MTKLLFVMVLVYQGSLGSVAGCRALGYVGLWVFGEKGY